MASQANILLVDDHQANLLALEVVLQPLGQEMIKARSGEEALRLLHQQDFAVVLLDIRLGGMDGFEVAQRIRAQERSRHTPIIFVTAFVSEDFSPAKAYTLGAVDYLVKPLEPEILRAKVDVFIKLYQRTEQVRQLQHHQSENEALHRLQKAMRRHAEELAEAHQQKDQFLAMLAHELRNPLAPLRTGVQILRQPQTPPEVRERTRDMMDRQLRHLSRLIDDLLDLSRVLRGKVQLRKELLDLRQVVRTAAEDRRPVIEQAELTLLLEIPETPINVMGDLTRLTQILNNLLDNTVKFANGRHRVFVRVEADDEQRQAVLSVRDEGIGIEPESLPSVFTPFWQADRSLDRSRGGLGLGLPMVKGLAELHGGSVEASSAGIGRGAEFTVRLPLSEAAPAPAGVPAVPQSAGKALRVLVIEDNRDAADSLRLLLSLLGHEARVAYSGPDGVAAAKEWQPQVVLCDIGLPGMDGYEAARQLRQLPGMAKAFLAAITGYGQDSDVQRCKESGIDYHFLKPIDPAKLNQLLANASKS